MDITQSCGCLWKLRMINGILITAIITTYCPIPYDASITDLTVDDNKKNVTLYDVLHFTQLTNCRKKVRMPSQ